MIRLLVKISPDLFVALIQSYATRYSHFINTYGFPYLYGAPYLYALVFKDSIFRARYVVTCDANLSIIVIFAVRNCHAMLIPKAPEV